MHCYICRYLQQLQIETKICSVPFLKIGKLLAIGNIRP